MSTPLASSNLLAPSPRRVEGHLSLKFERNPRSGQTSLVTSTQEPPLRVIRAFAREDGSALAHLHNVSGGLLGGDHLSLSVDLGPETNVQLTTTGATRIYRPRARATPAQQHNSIVVGENALLEHVPDAIIPFAGSRFVQKSEIHLSEGVGLFWWEILAPGREARGETFAYESLEMRTDIFAPKRLIAAERIRLQPALRPLHNGGRLGDFRYWVTFYVCRVGVDGARWRRLEQDLREVAREFVEPREMLWGISPLPAHGLAIRGLARRGSGLLPALHSLWRAAKFALYGSAPILPRKVN